MGIELRYTCLNCKPSQSTRLPPGVSGTSRTSGNLASDRPDWVEAGPCIWTPPHFASTPFSGDEVRLRTYIRPLSDLDQPRSGHDGLFARRLLIAFSGFAPVDICRLLRRRFDLFAILRGARNRGDVLLDQSERTGSGSHALRFIVRSVAQHRPGDPGHLVGEGGCCHVRVRSLGQRKGPAAEPIGLAWRCS